jgi:protein-tyrosine-phosphatase
MVSLLFVCTANVCRSPLAEYIMKQMIAEKENPEETPEDSWRVESAGTWGVNGSDMADGVKQVLGEMGIKPGKHIARTVNEEILNGFDLVLTMERGQKEAIKIEFPSSAENVYMISEMIGKRFDIRDPMGGTIDEFRKTAGTIKMILDQGFDKISQLISGS